MTGTPKMPKSPETIEKYGEVYRYRLKGVFEQEQAEFVTNSPSKFKEGRRMLWNAMCGGEPPNLS